MAHLEKTLSSQKIYEGAILHLRRDTVLLENGKTALREVVEHSESAGILALCEDGTIPFVRQFRYPFKTELLELPAGKIDPGETPEACARRELREETGYAAGSFVSLGKMIPTSAYLTEVIHLFLARDVRFVGQKLDPDEFVTIEYYTLDEALQKIKQGDILCAHTQTALLRYYWMRSTGETEGLA